MENKWFRGRWFKTRKSYFNKNNCAKVGKRLVTRKIKLRELKIIGTIVEN